MNQEELKVFQNTFLQLTGNKPLSWQERLFDQFVANDVKSVIDLPTGLGKTMVMAIWLIAREKNPQLGRRLIYVVDRRTVVDQATDLAEEFAYLLSADPAKKFDHVQKRKPELAERWKKLTELRTSLGQGLAISTLRGQLADNREWSRDPSNPAIIIGTVDLIGSALLFSGYRSSFKQRPLHAGLLGQDSLLVLDEAHLSKPFEKLVKAIVVEQEKAEPQKKQALRIIRMSATTAGDDKDRFKLESSDLDDPIIHERYTAKKTLTIEQKETFDAKLFADEAIKLAKDSSLNGQRIVVFVRSPESAKRIADAIRSHGDKKDKPYSIAVAVLTGTMRGLERDELVKKPVMKRFLAGNDPEVGPCFLISTSAGEVGFDLNADHMVCDLSPLDSLIQRLGRVNRRGGEKRSAKILMFAEIPTQKKDKNGKLMPLESFQMALKATAELLLVQTQDGNPLDVSPKALREFAKPEEALTPKPATVELTDILIDAWSMTSIIEPLPGRPEVAPWIRGIADELPQTTIAWRTEVELFNDSPYPVKAFKAIFAKHHIRPHESLTTNSYRVVEFLKSAAKVKGGRPDFLDTRVVVKLARSIVIKTIKQLIDDPGILNADPTLIFPANFGGLDMGMLSHEAIAKEPKPDDPPPRSLDIADQDGYEPREDDRARLRILIERTDKGWKPLSLPSGKPIPRDLNLKPTYDTSTLLFNDLRRTDLRVRLVQPVSFDEEGDPVQSLVMLSPVGDKSKKEDQLLTEHVGAVEANALRIANELKLGDDDPIRVALLFAAKWHDEGKKAGVWQTFANGPMPDGQPKGKMAQARDPKSLKHYRHEFGSILRIHHPDRCDKIDCTLPSDETTRNLALHLIATHHGGGRPHFPIARYDPFKEDERDALHTESIRRFARLQRDYGWWHLAWLENLLRCADQLASTDEEATEVDELDGGES